MNFLQSVLAAGEPYIIEMIGGLILIIITRLSQVASSRWGLEIEQRHRDALHGALMSGISLALQRGLRGSDAVDVAVAHARKSVPDALRRLDPAHDVLRTIAESKIPSLLQGIPAKS